MEYSTVQRIAKRTMDYIKSEIRPGMALTDVRLLCENRLMSLGADSFWYWDVGAFVFAGDETRISVSGREYRTSDRVIGENDIVTVDLSPQSGEIWGDYARTIVIEDGKVIKDAVNIRNDEWREGLLAEVRIHEEMCAFVEENTTFEQLYAEMNRRIERMGYVNLDFAGNLGHTIEQKKENRRYIEKGCGLRLADAGYFTFEPHIGKRGAQFGFKREDIYCFESGELKRL